jgi:hypothetical protein
LAVRSFCFQQHGDKESCRKGSCARWRFHEQTTEGFVVEKISSASFLFCWAREVVGVRFVDFCFEGKYENNPLRNVFRKAEYSS